MGWLTTTYLSPLSPGGNFSAIKDMVWLWDCSKALAKMQRGAKAELGGGGMQAGPTAVGLAGDRAGLWPLPGATTRCLVTR